MRVFTRILSGLILIGAMASLQGCLVAAAGAGAAGGYAASQHGYEVQSPVKKDAAGGYKGQSPVKHNKRKDKTRNDRD